ncbi:MAG: 30S ribosomal protein S16 [Bacteroidales bacterium]|nr:30S ribosomal protein S16 [Bacteroidales bacterium]
MAVKLRLARHGRKRKPYYYIIAADSRTPRDGKFIERIGSYNPITNPATIELDFDKALDWMMKGAQPTDTVKRILSYKGVLMKKHLLEGVKKGAFAEAEVEIRFNAWLEEKQSKISAKISDLSAKERAELKAKLEAETKIKDQRAQAIAKKYAKEIEAKAEAKAEAIVETPVEEPKAEAAVETPVEEPKAEAIVETPVEEPKAEATVETPVEEPKAEAAVETPVEEPKAEQEDKKEE